MYEVEIEFTMLRSKFNKSRWNFLSYDRIFHVVIELYFPIMHPFQDSKFDLEIVNSIST